LKKQFINPPELPHWEQSFTQVVIVENAGTRTVYLSGQVAVDRDNQLVGAGDLKLQANQAFLNLETALRAADATVTDVVKVNIYVRHYQPSDADVIREAFRKIFPHQNLPASTWLGVETLALEGLLIEVDAVAMLGS
jgi:enamine deaminase RidA (YjgF/YER057c/UK114 family)